MTCDDIIRMAKKAGSVAFNSEYIDGLERFAALVAAAERERMDLNSIHSCHADCQNPICVRVREAVAGEREACAKVCEDTALLPDAGPLYCAAAIRARGQ